VSVAEFCQGGDKEGKKRWFLLWSQCTWRFYLLVLYCCWCSVDEWFPPEPVVVYKNIPWSLSLFPLFTIFCFPVRPMTVISFLLQIQNSSLIAPLYRCLSTNSSFVAAAFSIYLLDDDVKALQASISKQDIVLEVTSSLSESSSSFVGYKPDGKMWFSFSTWITTATIICIVAEILRPYPRKRQK